MRKTGANRQQEWKTKELHSCNVCVTPIVKSFIVLCSTTNSFICTQLTNGSNVPSTFSKTKPLCPTPCSFMVLLHEHRWFPIMASTVFFPYINSLKLKCAISIQLSTNGIAKLFLNTPTSSVVQKSLSDRDKTRIWDSQTDNVHK